MNPGSGTHVPDPGINSWLPFGPSAPGAYYRMSARSSGRHRRTAGPPPIVRPLGPGYQIPEPCTSSLQPEGPSAPGLSYLSVKRSSQYLESGSLGTGDSGMPKA